MPMKRALIFGLALCIPLLGGVSAEAQNPSARPILPPPVFLNDTQKAELKRVSTYLNTLKTVQGRFMQIAADGRSTQGEFYLKKPGRLRFEYDQPSPILIVADGNSVAVTNSNLKTTDRYPLINSPLRLLLSENVDLSRDPRISAVKTEPGALSFTARENSGPAQGSITLQFADSGGPGLELRQWEVLDAQGVRTKVVLNNLRQVTDIPPQKFVIQELSPFKRGNN
jgi:outer membrane lipoprotein-sorting protein